MREENNIPKHWKIKKLGEVCDEIFAGGDVPKNNFSLTYSEEYQIPIYANGEKNKGLYGYTNLSKVNSPSVTISARGTIGYSEVRNKPFFPIVRLIVLKPNKDLDVLFLKYIIDSCNIKHTGSSIPQLTVPTVKTLLIPLPPLIEQQAIVIKIEELLSDLENGKQQLQIAQQQLKIYRQSLLKWAFEGKLSESGLSGLKDEQDMEILKKSGKSSNPENPASDNLPKGWKIVELGEVAEMCLGKMLDKTKNKGNYQYYLRNISVRWGNFNLDDLEQMRFEESEDERYSLKKGDLVICEGGEPGRCAIWKDAVPSMKIQKALHRVRVKNILSVKYLFHFMYYSGMSGLLEKYFTGTTIKHLTGRELKKIEIPLPSLAEQQLIVDELESKLTVCDKIEETISQSLLQAESLRQSILKKAFCGELVKNHVNP